MNYFKKIENFALKILVTFAISLHNTYNNLQFKY